MNIIFSKDDIAEGLLSVMDKPYYGEIITRSILNKKIDRLKRERDFAKTKLDRLFHNRESDWDNMSQKQRKQCNTLITRVNKLLTQINSYIDIYNKGGMNEKHILKLTKDIEKILRDKKDKK